MLLEKRNKILSTLFKSKEFNDCIKKMRPIEFQDDLRAEVALVLCELPVEQIVALDHQGVLKFYAVGVIQNLIQSSTSPFYKKYRSTIYINENTIEPYIDDNDSEEELNIRIISELKEEKTLKIIDELYWYNREMIKLYLKLGSYRDMEKETKIPWGSCYDTVRETINKIKYELRKKST